MAAHFPGFGTDTSVKGGGIQASYMIDNIYTRSGRKCIYWFRTAKKGWA